MSRVFNLFHNTAMTMCASNVSSYALCAGTLMPRMVNAVCYMAPKRNLLRFIGKRPTWIPYGWDILWNICILCVYDVSHLQTNWEIQRKLSIWTRLSHPSLTPGSTRTLLISSFPNQIGALGKNASGVSPNLFWAWANCDVPLEASLSISGEFVERSASTLSTVSWTCLKVYSFFFPTFSFLKHSEKHSSPSKPINMPIKSWLFGRLNLTIPAESA